MEFDRRNWGYTYITEEDIERQILGFLQQFPVQYLGKAEIAEELDEKQTKVGQALNDLFDNDRIRKRSGMSGQGNKIGYAYHQGGDDDSLAIT
jgi:predicted transcriptional regulator